MVVLHLLRAGLHARGLALHGARSADFRIHLPGSPLDLPEPLVVGVGEEDDKAVPVRRQGPGGVNGLTPAGHHTAVERYHQRRFFGWIIAFGYIDVPLVLQFVGDNTVALLEQGRIGLRVVAVFVDDNVAAFDFFRQVVPVVIVRGAGPKKHFTHSGAPSCFFDPFLLGYSASRLNAGSRLSQSRKRLTWRLQYSQLWAPWSMVRSNFRPMASYLSINSTLSA